MAMIVKLFNCLVEEKRMKYKRFLEEARNDVLRVFSVFQSRGAINKNKAREYINRIGRILYTCVILHNMIIEDNRRAICGPEKDYLEDTKFFSTRFIFQET